MLTAAGYNVISDERVASVIKNSPSSFVFYLGAGVSVEAGVPSAWNICDNIASDLLQQEERTRQFKGLTPARLVGEEREQYLNKMLGWHDEEKRYLNCVKLHFATPAIRVEYFRRLLEHKTPSFAHHAISLLMSNNCLARTALTTNFDKLIENAFTALGDSECQAIRMKEELQYWRQEPDKCYLLKLHGDYDTHNIVNTPEESVKLAPEMAAKATSLLTNAGLLVLGSAGREKSIYKFMDSAEQDESELGVLNHGLLWAVYVGSARPPGISEPEIAEIVQTKVAGGSVGPNIVELMQRRLSDQDNFAFFPIWGCGSFLWDLVRRILPEAVLGTTERYLDHELRIREVFRRNGLSESARERHVQALRTAQARLSANSPVRQHEYALQAETLDHRSRVQLAYGDVADVALLQDPRIERGLVKAVVSPEDTCLSVGGGAALAIAHRAGLRSVLNDLYKFAPVTQNNAIATSAFDLPVHYLIHAATVDVSEDGALTNRDAVRQTTANILAKVNSLGVEIVWIPLLGAGVAGLSPDQTAESILEAVNEWLSADFHCTIVITVFKESILPRKDFETLLHSKLTKKPITVSQL